jgi:hypothetical protein
VALNNSASSNHHNSKSSGHNTHQDSNQTSGQSMQAKNINSNAMDDTLAAVSMMQQLMTDLSGAATEQGKVIVITEVVLRLLKNNDNSSQTSENRSTQC